ncbi:ammonia-forming cytochrome c nitrite reductase subunit c552 [bacterium]|nr:ammonia-forming cytochrome c nitrite reductase subunit c552 [bacterium]
MKLGLWVYLLVIVLTAIGTFAITALLMDINGKKQEARQAYIPLVELDEETVDPAQWGKNFPRQYDGYLKTVDEERTRYGGSEAVNRLEMDPRLLRIFDGYAFAIEYNEERGHAYTLLDQEITERVKQKPQPGACLHCHASVMPAYRKAGNGDVMAGFGAVNKMPWAEARELVEHPVACIDCHDPETMQLRVTRPGFINGIRELKKLEGIENYDPNKMASRQEMRSFVCGQCHVEYYFKGEDKVLTYPWHKGLKVEEIEAYYDEVGHKDWEHKETGAAVLKAQHPEFELWSQGIHARNGVSCADCHMPYMREGAIKISDHWVRSPVLNVENACVTCHREDPEEMRQRIFTIQDRTKGLLDRAEDALIALYDEVKAAEAAGVAKEALEDARKLQRKAQFRCDFINAENSMGFHADQEAARILGEAIDYARQGQLSAAYARLKHSGGGGAPAAATPASF